LLVEMDRLDVGHWPNDDGGLDQRSEGHEIGDSSN
jgi:hypothetical protein